MTITLAVLLTVSILSNFLLIDRRDERERQERGLLLDRIERPGTVTSVVVADDGEKISGYEDDDEIRAALRLND